MPLEDIVAKTVTFVIAERDKPSGGTGKEPIGTAFIIALEEGGLTFRYVVTAAHCVRTEHRTWIRIPVEGEKPKDFRVQQWVEHSTEDIAVTPFDQTQGPWSAIPLAQSVHKYDRKARLGDRVYFLGLMRGVPDMADRNIPIVRSGTVGVLYQDNVPVKIAPDLTVAYQAHLIDCRSYAGFSGSPCIIQFEEWRIRDAYDPETKAVGKLVATGSTTLLFGIVIAHIEIPDEEGDKVNSGVGVVIPAEKIEETLQMDDLAQDRKDAIAARKAEQEGEGAVPDSVPNPAFSRGDFQRALKKVSRRVKPSEPDQAS